LQSVCNHQEEFACFVSPEHIGKCKVFFAQASAFGFSLPSTVDELESQCSGRMLAEAAVELKAPSLGALVSVQQATMSPSDSCNQGSAKIVHDIASECVAQCPQSCPALGVAIDAYFSGDLASARSAVCQHKDEFACFVHPDHLEECKGFFATASSFGVELPSSEAELQVQCNGGRRLRGSFLM